MPRAMLRACSEHCPEHAPSNAWPMQHNRTEQLLTSRSRKRRTYLTREQPENAQKRHLSAHETPRTTGARKTPLQHLMQLLAHHGCLNETVRQLALGDDEDLANTIRRLSNCLANHHPAGLTLRTQIPTTPADLETGPRPPCPHGEPRGPRNCAHCARPTR